MPKYKITKTGYEIANNAYVDKRLVLTKDEMLTAEEDFILPEHYFAYCPDDGGFYTYDVNYDVNSETGRYHKVNDAMAPFIKTILLNGKDVSHSSETVNLKVVEDILYNGISRRGDGNVDLSFLVNDVLVNEDPVVVDGVAKVIVPYTTSELIYNGIIKDGALQDLVFLNQFTQFEDSVNSELEKINNTIGGDSSESLISKIDRLDSELDSETLIRKQEINRLDTLIYNTSERITREVILLNDKLNSEAIEISKKQDKLVAGDFIVINNSEISALVNTAYLYLLKNNSELGRFNANSPEDVTINFDIPTKVSQIYNDLNFTTVPEVIGLIDDNKLIAGDNITITDRVISSASSIKDIRLLDSEGHSTSLVNSEGIAEIPSSAVAVKDVKTGTISRVNSDLVAELPSMSKGSVNDTLVLFSNNSENSDSHASSRFAIAIGTGMASGSNSIAAVDNIASNDNSVAVGEQTITGDDDQLVFGKFNIPENDFVELVGGGDSDSERLNLRKLDWIGNETLEGALISHGIDITPKQGNDFITIRNDSSEGGDFIVTGSTLTVIPGDSEIPSYIDGGIKLYGLQNIIRLEGDVQGFSYMSTSEDRDIIIRTTVDPTSIPSILYGSEAPAAWLGNDGDIYIELP